MLFKLIALTIVFSLVAADPISKISARTFNDLGFLSLLVGGDDDDGAGFSVALKPDISSLLLDAVTTFIGSKVSAVTIAADVIEWLISNSIAIVFGLVSTLGFCKLTDKCSLAYEEYAPVVALRGLITPEHMERAESFLVTAIEKYAQKRDENAANKMTSN